MIKSILHSKENLRRNMWHLCFCFFFPVCFSTLSGTLELWAWCSLIPSCYVIQRSFFFFFSLSFPHTNRKSFSLPGSLCTSSVSFHILYSIFTLLLCRCHKHTASFRQILQVTHLLPAASLRPEAQKSSEDSAQACDKLSGKFYIVREKE